MQSSDRSPNTRLVPLLIAWAALMGLSLLSMLLGEWLEGLSSLPALVGAIIWLKAWLVARYFLEAQLCITFLRRMIWVFIAFSPIALVLTDTFGQTIAKILQV